MRRFPHCGHLCTSLNGLLRYAFCLGTGVGFEGGGGGNASGWDFDPADVGTEDDDELSLAGGGIIVPGLRFLENVEDFWGSDRGGATTGTSRDGEDIDGLRSVRRRLGCTASEV